MSPSPAEPGVRLQLSATLPRVHVKLGGSHVHLNTQLERQHQVSSKSGITSSGYSWTKFLITFCVCESFSCFNQLLQDILFLEET